MNARSTGNAIVATAVAAIAAFFARGAQGQSSKDGQVIAQLKKFGSDLSRPHPIEFYLYMPTREGADRVVANVRALGCGIKKVDRAAAGPGWLVLATKTMVPLESELSELRRQ